ncbi:tyrosine-type recombinase/integrase [Mycobacteroides abscessus]|uniref:tyrosine-type recombinase/integrase n=1 Tax=Mycobacteroides abscessus TaxID=36809 RepID=UPI0009A71CB6|nr:site-specific integrase [Mycobacteroides abscessus]
MTVPGPIPGKQERKTVSAKDRATALARRKKLLEDVAKGNITRSPKLTVAQWLDHWLEKIHKPNVKPKTYRYYESGIRLLIKPHIGNKQLAKLTPEDIRDLIKVIQRTSTRNAVKAHQILQTALKGAIREGVLERNVVTMIKKPNHVTAEIPPFTTHQAKHIMRTAIDLGDPLADRWSFAFLTVARPSELNGLEWSRVDFDNKVLDLSWQLQELTSKRHGCGEPDEAGAYPCGRKRAGWCPDAEFDFEPGFEYRPCHGTQVWTRPKTAKGKRPLPLIEPLEAMLRLRLKRQKPGPLDLVWAHDDGRPYGPTELNERWHALMVAAGLETEMIAVETDESDAECNEIESVSGDPESPDLPSRVLYAARHTAATLLMELGVPEDVRMAIMGQSSVVAHRGYVHVDQTQMKAALSKLNELVNPALH